MTISTSPYCDASLNFVYNLLFCDDISLFKNQPSDSYPWKHLLDVTPDTAALEKVAADRSQESRARLVACRLLNKIPHPVPTREIFAVVIEVGLDDGLDVLAAFSDGTARYINHSEKLLVWETRTTQSDTLINDLFQASATVVSRIGPWTEARRAQPGAGMIRMSFLVSDGLYFGEGPFEVLQRDAMGGPVVEAATKLMVYLTEAGRG